MSLTLVAQPGFTELPDSDFDAGNPASDANMKALNADAKFAAVRCEQFWGYYRNGETVVLPVSAADGYQYQQSECLFSWSLRSTQPSVSALLGSQATPTFGANGGGGEILLAQYNVDQTTGQVTCLTWYFNGTTNTTSDGVLMVITHALRQR